MPDDHTSLIQILQWLRGRSPAGIQGARSVPKAIDPCWFPYPRRRLPVDVVHFDRLARWAGCAMGPDDTIGHYRITAKLGQGGMGAVYRAMDTKLQREVAIKVIPEKFARDHDRLARFTREAQILAGLNHPNIAAIYGVEGRALILELVEGPTLSARIKQGPIPVDEALPLIHQLIDALQYAHEKGVIHRDLKPSNIKISLEGRLKVLDFGLARMAQVSSSEQLSAMEAPEPASATTLTMRDTTSDTATGMIIGTASYMSPEQARGQSADSRADIWAFGAIAYEMTTGQKLFKGPTVSDTLAAVLVHEPDLDSFPPQLRRLVRVCLSRDPHHRLLAIGDARLLLEETPAPLLPAPVRRPVTWMLASAVFAIIAILGVTLWRSARPVDHPLVRLRADLGPEALPGANLTAAIAPDGDRIAFVARAANGASQLATRLLNQPKPALLAGTEGAADPFFSPDGRWIGFFAGGKLKKISVDGGAAVTLCETGATGLRGAAWGADGYLIATLSVQSGGGLSRVPEAGGPPRALTNPATKKEATHRWPQILPGGQSVLFTGNTSAVNHDSASLEVLSLKSGEWKVVHRGGYYGRYLPSGHLVYVHQGTLFGAPFDLARLEVRGSPVPLLDDVAANVISGGGQFDFSRNGTLLYLNGRSASGGWTIAWLDSTGKLEPLPAKADTYLNPRLSPDGRLLAVGGGLGRTGVAIYDWQRDTLTGLTVGPGDRYPIWAPDGNHIAFRSPSSAGYSIDWVRTDGAGEVQRLLEPRTSMAIGFSLSSDGKRLAFVDHSPETGLDIWMLPLDLTDPDHPKPGKPEPFLRTPSNESQPVFSPDGRWLAHVSNETGRTEVYVRPLQPGARWQISSGGGNNPLWSHSARDLFFETLDNHIMVVNYTANADSFTADKPRLWSSTPIFPTGAGQHADLALDGKRLLVFTTPDAPDLQKGSVHVTVLLNFFDELRRRIPGGNR